MNLKSVQDLSGEYVSEVRFVMDYVQFGFGSSMLTVYSLIIISLQDVDYKFPDIGSRDAICYYIGKPIRGVELREREYLALFFTEGFIKILLNAPSRNFGDGVEFFSERGMLISDH